MSQYNLLTDCGHFDISDSTVVELYRCNLSNSDWNSWASENVAGLNYPDSRCDKV